VRCLRQQGYENLLTRSREELDLCNQEQVNNFFRAERPEYVFIAAAKVGGISANDRYPADFILENLLIQTNLLKAAHQNNIQRLLFLGSSCIYPKFSPQPMEERYLLSGPLEETNRPYAVAKIAGIEMCWSFNRQFKTKFLGAMPTNLFGIGDNYHPENSHVIPGLIRRFHEAKIRGQESVAVWGTGSPKREFLYSEDMADACVFLMNLPDDEFVALLGQDRNNGPAPIVNIGVGTDISIRSLAEEISSIVGFKGTIDFDPSKPDGTPQKLLSVDLMNSLGWKAKTSLRDGLAVSYNDFLHRYE
jgi:GDP-L-fucose synthase